jgi:hypothetical protein
MLKQGHLTRESDHFNVQVLQSESPVWGTVPNVELQAWSD